MFCGTLTVWGMDPVVTHQKSWLESYRCMCCAIKPRWWEFYILKLLFVRNKDDGDRVLALPLQMQGMTDRAHFDTEKKYVDYIGIVILTFGPIAAVAKQIESYIPHQARVTPKFFAPACRGPLPAFLECL